MLDGKTPKPISFASRSISISKRMVYRNDRTKNTFHILKYGVRAVPQVKRHIPLPSFLVSLQKNIHVLILVSLELIFQLRLFRRHMHLQRGEGTWYTNEHQKKYFLRSKDRTNPTVRIVAALSKRNGANFMDSYYNLNETFDVIFVECSYLFRWATGECYQ